MLMAFLLVVQLLCVVSSAFAADSADDIHHSYQAASYLEFSQHADTSLDAPDAADHIDCDHCSHCHVAHLGLFKTGPALAAASSGLLVGYNNQLPSSPKRNIYRPPIH